MNKVQSALALSVDALCHYRMLSNVLMQNCPLGTSHCLRSSTNSTHSQHLLFCFPSLLWHCWLDNVVP